MVERNFRLPRKWSNKILKEIAPICNNDIININGLFRSIVIQEGENEYIMEFKPKDLYIGKLISNMLYIFLLLMICFNLYKAKVKNV